MDLLLVEDEPALAKLLTDRLGRVGFQVHWATTVADAVGALLQRPHAVVLLDILLKQGHGRPDQNGLDVAREMRRAGIGTPFVIMTSFPTFEHGVEIGELRPAAVLEKTRGVPLIIDACQAAAAAAAAAAAVQPIADPQAFAREELADVDLARADAAERCSSVLLRAVGHPAITFYQCMPLHLELVRLGKAGAVPDLARMVAALSCPPQSGHADVDFLLHILSAGHIASNTELARACGRTVRWVQETSVRQTGHGPAKWRCLSRGWKFVVRIGNSRDSLKQCADAAGYRYGRQSVPECRRLFGKTPREIRRLLARG